ncbi:uncharacterized protein [Antedon mediterranea]|uniref:uncharacterized protein n=1 Tax=Antedon mediterranea TaxID=105859 RepID=UPI003AF90769
MKRLNNLLNYFRWCFTIFIQLAVIHVINSVQTDSEACNSCCTPGVPGIPGNHGNPGVSGPQGLKREKGVKGEQGIDGEHGMKGDNGRNGSDGIPGKLGPKGPQGLIGLPGANGVKGKKGAQASQKKSAFTAAFVSSPGRATGPLKFDTIITNVGNHYNRGTGKFVCAIPGVYVFQVTSMKSSGGGQIATRIMKNGSPQVSTWVTADGHNSASTMVVLDLISGDQVWTEPHPGSVFNYYHSNSNKYCSFSGFLLFNMFFITHVIQFAAILIISSVATCTDSEACNNCCTAGVPGIHGQPGNPGIPGSQGLRGIRGEQGMKGETGLKGEQGIKGDNGIDGIPGNTGLIGARGPMGPPGATGIRGEKGEQASQKKSAFTAVFRSNPGRYDTSPMKYDTIITNVGNHYNLETGKFVCVIPGVYVFQVTSMKDIGSGKIVTRIKKNGTNQVAMEMDASGFNSASTMVVLDLISGDEVWTEPHSTTYNYYHSNTNGYCSFSGFLLYAA